MIESVQEIYEQLVALGCNLRVDGDKLRVTRPTDGWTSELKQFVGEHKPALLDLIGNDYQQQAVQSQGPRSGWVPPTPDRPIEVTPEGGEAPAEVLVPDGLTLSGEAQQFMEAIGPFLRDWPDRPRVEGHELGLSYNEENGKATVVVRRSVDAWDKVLPKGMTGQDCHEA